MYGRDEIDQPRRDPQTSGSSSQGTTSQSNQRTAWQSRPGQGVPAFPGSRIVPTRGINSREILLWYDKGPEAYKGDFGEDGGSPVDSIEQGGSEVVGAEAWEYSCRSAQCQV